MIHQCIRCDKVFKPNRGKQRYCTRACSALGFRGSNHPRYKGGHIRPDGYHIIQVNGKRMLSHRHIMEQHLGRHLEKSEVVHHRDGNPSNNMLDNLVLTKNQSEHVKSHCKHFRSDTHKQCSKCKIIKPRSEFTPAIQRNPGDDPSYSSCKKCKANKK